MVFYKRADRGRDGAGLGHMLTSIFHSDIFLHFFVTMHYSYGLFLLTRAPTHTGPIARSSTTWVKNRTLWMCNETYTNLFKNDHTTLLWSLFSNTIAISWRKLSLNTNFGIVWTELVPRTLRQRIFDPRKQTQFEEEFHIYIHQTIGEVGAMPELGQNRNSRYLENRKTWMPPVSDALKLT